MFRHIRGRSVTFAVTEARVLSLYLRATNTQCERTLEERLRLMLNLMLVTLQRHCSQLPKIRIDKPTSNHSVGLWHNTGRIISTYTTWCRQPGNAARQQTSRARAGHTGPPPDVQDAGSDTRGWRNPSTTQRPVVYAGYVAA